MPVCEARRVRSTEDEVLAQVGSHLSACSPLPNGSQCRRLSAHDTG
ncbi:hypothetical protein [Arthrobacter echini]